MVSALLSPRGRDLNNTNASEHYAARPTARPAPDAHKQQKRASSAGSAVPNPKRPRRRPASRASPPPLPQPTDTRK
eukprot:scaffold28650_cov56-Phaeocystis_antarctica.AAC.1